MSQRWDTFYASVCMETTESAITRRLEELRAEVREYARESGIPESVAMAWYQGQVAAAALDLLDEEPTHEVAPTPDHPVA